MYIDSNGHEIKWSYDRSKGNVWSRPRNFGEFHHLDGTVACNGAFTEKAEKDDMTVTEELESISSQPIDITQHTDSHQGNTITDLQNKVEKVLDKHRPNAV
jgi:hypothetical protein